jgi:phosphohistidine phosphatase SixA
MTKRFVFVRHGDYDKAGLSLAERKTAPLTELGASQALEMGAWLKAQGIELDEVVTTEAERTKETADWMLMAMDREGLRPKAVAGGFALGKSGLDEKLGAWRCRGETVCFVGHCKQQTYCVSALGGPELTTEQRAVMVYEREDNGEWVYLDGVVF